MYVIIFPLQAFWEDCKQKLSEMTDVDKKCMDKSKEYYLKCIEICWPMALHNPPLYIKMDVQHGEPVNLDLYTCRSSGDFVDIMVWPPLYQGFLATGTSGRLGGPGSN